MILVRKIKLVVADEQRPLIIATMRAVNAARNEAAKVAFEAKAFRRFDIHRLVYQRLRAKYELSAQATVHVIASVAACFARDKKTVPVFRDLAAVTYDSRILSMKDGVVSLWCLGGRIKIPARQGPHRVERVEREADLVLSDGEFYLHACVEVSAAEPVEPDGFLGVDLGIVNVAVDSDGHVYSGKSLNSARARHARLRQKLQGKGTRSATRLLKKRRRKESRFARHTNHCISKALVTRAQGTGRGIALEDLEGIRDRTTVRKAQRRVHHSWSFAQLRQFVTYKAVIAGVALVMVDPRNTSRTCPGCGHVDKANRKSQSLFQCVRCGHAGLADRIAAVNISGRAQAIHDDERGRVDVNRPDASRVVVKGPHVVS